MDPDRLRELDEQQIAHWIDKVKRYATPFEEVFKLYWQVKVLDEKALRTYTHALRDLRGRRESGAEVARKTVHSIVEDKKLHLTVREETAPTLCGSNAYVGMNNCGWRWAKDIGAVVCSVEYRRPPLEGGEVVAGDIPARDCLSVLAHVWREHERLKIDRERIMVYGASAGGCLALALTLMLGKDEDKLKDSEGVKVKVLYLESPMLDDRYLPPENKHPEPFLTVQAMKLAWEALLGKRSHETYDGKVYGEDGPKIEEVKPTEYVIPGRAESYKNFPVNNVCVAITGEDVFADDNRTFVDRLWKEAGIRATVHLQEKVPHGFWAIFFKDPISQDMIQKRDKYIREQLTK